VDGQPWAEPDAIRWILENCRTWAIVGLADNPSRAAHGVARFLKQRGKRIVPVHPRAETVWGEQGYPSLADIPFPVDCVDVFRRAGEAGQFADQAVAVGAQAVWFQLDVIDEAAFGRARAAGLRMVMDRCPAIEWSRHGPTQTV
jgi:predicted CoA-binding protein